LQLVRIELLLGLQPVLQFSAWREATLLSELVSPPRDARPTSLRRRGWLLLQIRADDISY
jgi:hypothetical protein